MGGNGSFNHDKQADGTRREVAVPLANQIISNADGQPTLAAYPFDGRRFVRCAPASRTAARVSQPFAAISKSA